MPLSAVVDTSGFADVDGQALTFTMKRSDGSALPSWLTFANGRLTGTPPATASASAYADVATNRNNATSSAIPGQSANVARVVPSGSRPIAISPALTAISVAATSSAPSAVDYGLRTGSSSGCCSAPPTVTTSVRALFFHSSGEPQFDFSSRGVRHVSSPVCLSSARTN